MKKRFDKILFIILIMTNAAYVDAQEKNTETIGDTVVKQNHDISTVANQVLNKVFDPEKTFKADSIIQVFDDSPSFEIYKDNYVVIGTDPFSSPDKENSDAKFQISFRQRLTNSVLPFKTYLFVSYTQLAYWDVFKKSFPFRDINFNPTVGVGRPLVRGNSYLGELSFQLEHESNGKDEESSRSWNKLSLSGLFKFSSHWTYFTKVWIPIVDGQNNSDIVNYKGWAVSAINYNQHDKYNISLMLNKRKGISFNANITINFAYKFRNENQYLFLEYYDGYGESLLDYNKYTRRLRLGFVIKPNFRFIY